LAAVLRILPFKKVAKLLSLALVTIDTSDTNGEAVPKVEGESVNKNSEDCLR
jgi:hypothetical protein